MNKTYSILIKHRLLHLLLVSLLMGCTTYKVQQKKPTRELVVNILDFGAKNNQISTIQIQKAIDYAALKNGSVYIPNNQTFLVSTLVLKNGVRKIYGEGILKGINIKETGAIIETERNNLLQDCYISVKLDLSNGAGYGFLGRGITNCSIVKCDLVGFTDSAIASRIGIFLGPGSSNNKIADNTIIGFENPTSRKSSIGIYLQGKGASFGGFFNNGQITDPTLPTYNSEIKNNYIAFGKVGIDLLATENIEVHNNHLYKNKTRAIYLANSTNNSSISSNLIDGFGASAVVIGYGSHHNTFSNNTCHQILDYNHYAGEAAININTGAHSNVIKENDINSFTHYGIYLGVNMINNIILKNKIKGYYLAAIALENEFQDTPPKEAKYSRPNYGKPLIGKKWASKDSYGNVIKDNIIGDSYLSREVGSIYVSQLGQKYMTRDNVIENNILLHDQKNNISLLFFEETNGMLINNILVGNINKKINPRKLFFSRGAAHFKEIRDNDGVEEYFALKKN